ncbi:hypothetical protein NDI54_01080 [Haloarcula sp. S1AR25-5A]|uniref:Uncharacterized protein n=1 Tax=Haloarcula terrestris TaxID=2950533 RepID=A0AAE4ETL0_9EURY|nr:hypothetical protein [Haloarcula terrestris]MDS0219940.1 hypothetical protein [Haloarcula terrestris]
MAEECDTCGRSVTVDEAIRRETFGDLDNDRWQTLCRLDYGARFQTTFVGRTLDGERDRWLWRVLS